MALGDGFQPGFISSKLINIDVARSFEFIPKHFTKIQELPKLRMPLRIFIP